MNINFVRLCAEARLPVFGSAEAAGADVVSVEDVVIPVGKWRLVKTGLGCVIPPGWELQVRPRSGLALKHGVTVLNAPGTIDSDYTGELGVLLINHGRSDFYVRPGDRIAQIVAARVEAVEFLWVDNPVRVTERGDSGFGSTGTGSPNLNYPYSICSR